jgi:hypothetical protein
MMAPANICMLMIALAAALGAARYVLSIWKKQIQQPRLWRVLSMIVLQFSSAALLYFCLFPPPVYRSQNTEQLVILTENADANANSTHAPGRLLALPEATSANNSIERVPDLASALRRYPNASHLHIIGNGLSARDINAAKNIAMSFKPSPLPSGIVELWLPDAISAGARWFVQGRVAHAANARAELYGPDNTLIQTVALDSTGGFSLGDTARSPGFSIYQIRIVDQSKKRIDAIDVPVNSIQAPAIKILSLSGGPNPDLKYLHRWASDAGIELDSQVSLSAGISMRTAPVAINSASLKKLDLLMFDERAWTAMNRSSQQAVVDALQDGLGVMLRVTGPINSNDRRELRALGFNIEDDNGTQNVQLENIDKNIGLTRQAISVSSNDGVTFLRDDGKKPLAIWRTHGRGRIGLWWLNDTHRLALSENTSAHGQLWETALSTLARPSKTKQAAIDEHAARVNERSIFCDIAAKAYVRAGNTDITYLLPENNSQGTLCAAFWPTRSGWHELVSAEISTFFYVRNNSEALGLKINAMQQATLKRVAQNTSKNSAAAARIPGTPWPWFFSWLFVTTLLWALERSRMGLR